MTALFYLCNTILIVSLLLILIILLYDRLLVLLPLPKKPITIREGQPFISLVIVVRNGEKLIVDKLKNSLSLQNFGRPCEIVVYSDGSEDKTSLLVESLHDGRIKFISSEHHLGKNRGLNKSVEVAEGEIIVFSDVDAMLKEDALTQIAPPFSDPSVGGVCGAKAICEPDAHLKEAQSVYVDFDSAIKERESEIGSITSNNGKLHAIRRRLYHPLPDGVTDDLYICMTIVKQGFRFLYEPKAMSYIRVPARSPEHEISRRRRIVSRSLRGIFMMREILNPFRYGVFALSLTVNKIARRMLPFFLMGVFLSSLSLMFMGSAMAAVLFSLQACFYGFGCVHWLFLKKITDGTILGKLGDVVFYFCAGNYGTLLGILDFVTGKRLTRWNPIKHD